MTIVEFLLARIAEDETAAQGSLADVANRRTLNIPPSWLDGVARRVLAECEAKRLIVEESALWGCQKTMCKILALPYVGHPDYDEAWRP